MTPHTGLIQLTRSFGAPPARLWALLTDGKAREVWGAPSDDDVLKLDTSDVREGGHDRHHCGPAEAPEYVIDTHWYHLSAPDVVCFTETLTVGDERLGVSLVTCSLVETSTGTDLTVDVALSSIGAPDMTQDFSDGWTSALSRLDKMITSGDLS